MADDSNNSVSTHFGVDPTIPCFVVFFTWNFAVFIFPVFPSLQLSYAYYIAYS